MRNERSHDEMIRKIMGELKQTFKPEFLNRIDATIVFHSLREVQIYQIVDLLLKRVRNQLVEQEIKLEVTEPGKDPLWRRALMPPTAPVRCAAPSRTRRRSSGRRLAPGQVPRW